MHSSVKRLSAIQNKVNEIIDRRQLKTDPKIIAVTKTFKINKITPLLEIGHIHFGENKIQETEQKWLEMKKKYENLKLHMLGKLQSNKVKKALKLFDYIHSLDNEKLAMKLSKCENATGKKIKFFIQINIAKENQKSGILLTDLSNFYNYCSKDLALNIIGLMCMPPYGSDSNKYFKILKHEAEKLNLKHLSMGMSSDYEIAVSQGSTFLRLGTAIFGERNT